MKIIGEILRPDPKIVYLEPVFGCNYRCFFCMHGTGDPIRPVIFDPPAFEKIKPVVEKAAHVHMTGLGEPLLNPHLVDYLTYFRDNDKSYYINTNGSLIDDAHIDVMTTSKCELSVSIDAGDKETYAKMRHKTNWDTVVSRIKKVSKVRADRKSQYPLLYLTWHINALNLLSLNNLPELARELGVEGVKLAWTMLPESHREHSIFNRKDEVNHLVNSVGTQLQRAGITMQNEAAFDKHVRGCWQFNGMAFIGANGAVAACCSRWPNIGNIHDNCFEDIWSGMPRRRIALSVLNKQPEGTCEKCAQIRGQNYEDNEDDFIKPNDLDAEIIEEKTKNIGKLPSLEGLNAAFRSGVNAVCKGEFQEAVGIFSALEEKFPDFFEIKNNLAISHFYLGNVEKCMELLTAIKLIPHNKLMVESSIASLNEVLDAAQRQ